MLSLSGSRCKTRYKSLEKRAEKKRVCCWLNSKKVSCIPFAASYQWSDLCCTMTQMQIKSVATLINTYVQIIVSRQSCVRHIESCKWKSAKSSFWTTFDIIISSKYNEQIVYIFISFSHNWNESQMTARNLSFQFNAVASYSFRSDSFFFWSSAFRWQHFMQLYTIFGTFFCILKQNVKWDKCLKCSCRSVCLCVCDFFVRYYYRSILSQRCTAFKWL